MTKLVKLIDQKGACVKLELAHAQSVLQLQASQGREDWILDSKTYIWDKNVIKRKPINRPTKDSKEQE